MLIIPAIDLYQGSVVRLIKGNKNNCTIYSRQPLSVAKEWAQRGATWLHLVDLSAAFSEGQNRKTIAKIVRESGLLVQLGGGIRSLEQVQVLADLGISRLVLGTAATDQDFLQKAAKIAGPGKIAVAVDEKDGKVAISGWQEQVDISVTQYLDYLEAAKVERVIYTDTSSDGTLSGPNLSRLELFCNRNLFNFIFSGGVSSLEDIQRLKQAAPFAEGVIVGKALYEQRFKLEEAIRLIVDNS